MQTKNTTSFAILGALASRASSGYDLKKFLEQQIGHFWKISYGQVYPLLKVLAQSNLASVREQTQKGRPPRYLYTITPEGQAQLRNWLHAPLDPESPNLDREVMLRLFFGRFSEANMRIRQVEQLKVWSQGRADQHAAAGKALKQQHESNPDLPFWLITASSGTAAAIALTDWCDQTLTALKGLK